MFFLIRFTRGSLIHTGKFLYARGAGEFNYLRGGLFLRGEFNSHEGGFFTRGAPGSLVYLTRAQGAKEFGLFLRGSLIRTRGVSLRGGLYCFAGEFNSHGEVSLRAGRRGV